MNLSEQKNKNSKNFKKNDTINDFFRVKWEDVVGSPPVVF